MVSIFLMLVQIASAGIHQAPPNFQTHMGRAVFVDFITAKYDLKYDLKKKEATVDSEITFMLPEAGFPVFDSVRKMKEVTIDGKPAETEMIYSPDAWSYLVRLNTFLTPGVHVMKSKNVNYENVEFGSDGVASATWFDDILTRDFLELYAPANLEFDQVQMDFTVTITEADGLEHEIYTNGQLTKIAENQFSVHFPAFFTSSSIFFHLMPKNTFPKLQGTYTSVDGREIPITIYGHQELNEMMEDTLKTLAELENDYGPWPHPAVLIYSTDIGGGMEYSGATVTNLWALQHELFHSYHARSQMPANGDSGWLDEAIASFRDYEYGVADQPPPPVNMAGRSPYARGTSIFAYTLGKDLRNYLNRQFQLSGLNFKSFLRAHYEKFPYQTVTTQMFIQHLNSWSGKNFNSTFAMSAYGALEGSLDSRDTDAPAGSMSAYRKMFAPRESIPRNPHHPGWTREQKISILR